MQPDWTEEKNNGLVDSIYISYYSDCIMNDKIEEYKIWKCQICGFIYNEKEGWPDDGIPPGTKWEDVDEEWVCPSCGVGKEEFEMEELY